MELKGANTLRVEACAVLHFHCSGNSWTRIKIKPVHLITSRQASPDLRS
jgi:hypothetical protein